MKGYLKITTVLLYVLSFIPEPGNAQQIINKYYKVISITNPGCGTCDQTCSPTFVLGTGFGAATTIASDFSATLNAPNNEVLIIQMRADKTVGTYNNIAGGFQYSKLYGQVTNLGGAGNYEFAQIATISG